MRPAREGADSLRLGRADWRGAIRLGIVLIACAAAWIAYKVHTQMVSEDALITYRYAENLARGRGFVFNEGERVLGTTTPLFALLLGVLGSLLGPRSIPAASTALMLAASLSSLALVHATLRRVGASPAFAVIAVAYLGLHPETLWSTASGLETPLVILLMMLGLHAVTCGHWYRAAAASGLLVMTRPDGAVWAIGLLAMAAWRLRAGAWKPAVVGLGVLAPWLVFSQWYFGSIIPHSIVAKREILTAVNVNYADWFRNSLWLSVPPRLMPWAFALWLMFLASGALRILRSSATRILLPLVVVPIVFGAALWAARAPLFAWYTIPMTWCLGMVGVLGSETAVTVVAARVAERRRPWARVALAGTAWACLAAAVVRVDLLTATYQQQNQRNETGLRARVGTWLRDHTAARAGVATEAIGYIGTYSERRIIDLAGLVSPQVVAIHALSGSNGEAFYRVLRGLAPQAIVLRSFEVDQDRHAYGGPLFGDPGERRWFLAHYREGPRFAAPLPAIWGEDAYLTIYLRSELPVVPAGP